MKTAYHWLLFLIPFTAPSTLSRTMPLSLPLIFQFLFSKSTDLIKNHAPTSTQSHLTSPTSSHHKAGLHAQSTEPNYVPQLLWREIAPLIRRQLRDDAYSCATLHTDRSLILRNDLMRTVHYKQAQLHRSRSGPPCSFPDFLRHAGDAWASQPKLRHIT